MYASEQPLVNPHASAFALPSSSSYPSSSAMAVSASCSTSSLPSERPDLGTRRSRSDSSNSSTSSISSNATAVAGGSNASSHSVSSRAQSVKLGSIASSPKQANTHLTVQPVARALHLAQQRPQQRPIIYEEEYQDEVIEHMREMESVSLPNLELMNAQPELRWFMRPYLVDFIIEIHQTFRLRPETLYLTMNIADRYVSKRIVFKRHYQLVGSAALLIASKYEDAKDRVPTIADLSLMCCQAYDESAFLQMEGHILQTLSWQLGHPTPEAWLRILCMQSPEESTTQNVSRFLMENTLFHRNFIGVPSSLIASGALMLARYLCRQEPRTYLASSSLEDITSIAQMIDTHIGPQLDQLSMILVKKYSYQHFSAASTVVKNFYSAGQASQRVASAKAVDGTFKPAHSVFMTPSSSTDSMDEGNDSSMESSGCSTPSSMASTPSRYRRAANDDDEDDDEDMPVTPLTAQGDPMASASSSTSMSPSRSGKSNKENQSLHPHSFPRSTSTGSNSSISSAGSIDVNINLNMKESNVFDKIPSITVQHVHARGTAAAEGRRPALTTTHTWQATA